MDLRSAAKLKTVVASETVTLRYGFRFDDIHAAAKAIRPLLKIRWKKLSDPFWGGDYYLKMAKDGTIIKLHHNYEAQFGHWLQPEYKSYPILLLMQYPSGTRVPDAYELLAQFMPVVKTALIPPNSDAWEDGQDTVENHS